MSHTEPEIQDERLVIDVIDDIAATEPERIWGSLPANDSDLSKGFLDVNFGNLSRAIDNAAFWLDSVLRAEIDGDIFAFFGDRDFRQPIQAAAAAKTGRRYQFISPFTVESSILALLDATGCKVWIHTQSGQALAKSIVNNRPGVRAIECPRQTDLLEPVPGQASYHSLITWDEAKNKSWIIMHTSGSSGNPKPVPWTHRAFRSTERFKRFKNFGESKTAMFQNRRVFQPLACVHALGLIASFDIGISMNSPMVIGPRDRMPDLSDIRQIFRYGNINGIFATPFFIRQITEDADLLTQLRQLDFVYYGGAKADQKLGDLICQHTSVGPVFGATEIGHIPVRNLLGADWHWYDFYPWEGIAFEEVKPGLFEMVFNRVKDDGGNVWQHAFSSFPHLDQYRTKDLWVRHPDKPSLYAYHGRTDDFVMLTHGDGVDAPYLESKLESGCRAIELAMVGGNGQTRPWLLVELRKSVVINQDDHSWGLDLIRVLDELNATLPNITKISPRRIIIASPGKLLVRTGKAALDRKRTAELYKDEIAALDAAL